jgi:carbonic anhydrase
MSPVPARITVHPFATALASPPGSLLPILAALALSLPGAAWPSDVPQLKPMKASAELAKPAKPDKSGADEHGTKVATAAPPAPDPLDTLRQRLAGKLSTGKVSEGAGPMDVHVVAKTAAAPAPSGHGGGHAAPRAAKAGGHGAAPLAAGSAIAAAGHGGAAHWAYQGPAGPQTWGGLKAEFSLCSSGQRQSPIDIRGGLAVDLDPVKFSYTDSRFGVIDNGHTVQANIAPGNSIEIGGKRYDLVQFHFHRPSEERIDGRQFEMSVHLVHKDDMGKLAVVGILVDKGPPQGAIQKVWNSLPLEKGEEAAARMPLNLEDMLPTDRRYFTYMGSLTTPPCSEDVRWVVMRQPVTMSPDQIELFARMYPMNARPVQQASGRRILQSQ